MDSLASEADMAFEEYNPAIKMSKPVRNFRKLLKDNGLPKSEKVADVREVVSRSIVGALNDYPYVSRRTIARALEGLTPYANGALQTLISTLPTPPGTVVTRLNDEMRVACKDKLRQYGEAKVIVTYEGSGATAGNTFIYCMKDKKRLHEDMAKKVELVVTNVNLRVPKGAYDVR